MEKEKYPKYPNVRATFDNKFTLELPYQVKNVLIPIDKQKHMLVGILMYLLVGVYSTTAAIILVLVVAVLKEGYDLVNRDEHTPEVMDIVATIGVPLVAYIGGLI